MSYKSFSPRKVKKLSKAIFESKPRKNAIEYITVSNYTLLARKSIEARNAKTKAMRTLREAKRKFGGNDQVIAFHDDLLFIAENLDPENHQSDRQIAEFFLFVNINNDSYVF